MAGSKRAGSVYIGLQLATQQFQKSIDDANKALRKFGKDSQKLGKDLGKSISAPLLAIGAASLAAFDQVDTALDSIRVGTGKTGVELGKLEKSFKTVFANTPADAAQVGKTIADLSTKLGLTGAPLEALTTQFVNLARITGTDLNAAVTNSTQVFNKWGVEAAAQGGLMDYLFKVTQETGIQFTDLTSQLTQSQTVFNALGLSVEQSAALLGQLSKSGYDSTTAISGLQIGIKKLADAGVSDIAGELQAYIERIKAAGSESAATAIAIEVFGKSGVKMAGAIRSGALDIGTLTTKLSENKDTINAAAADTADFGEALKELKNAAILGLAPVGASLNQMAKDALPGLKSAVTAVGDAWEALGPKVQKLIIVFGGIVTAFSGVLIGGGLLVGFLGGPMVLAVAAAGLAVAGLIVYWDDLKKAMQSALDKAKSVGKGVVDELTKAAKAAKDELSLIWSGGVTYSGGGPGGGGGGGGWGGDAKKEVAEQKELAAGVSAAHSKIQETIDKTAEAAKKLAAAFGGAGGGAGGGHSLDKAAGEANDALADMREELAKVEREFGAGGTKDIGKAIQEAIANPGNGADFTELLEQFRKATYDGILAGYSDAIKKGGPEVQKLAEQSARIQTEAQVREVSTTYKEALIKAETEAHKKATDAWVTVFQNAITGVTFSWKDALTQLAVGFAAELANSIFGALGEGIESLTDLGAELAKSIFSEVAGAATGGGSSGGPSFWDLAQQVLFGTDSGGDSGGMTTDASGKSIPGGVPTGGFDPMAAAAAVAVQFLPMAIDFVSGLFEDSKDPQTEARDSFEGFFEDKLKQLEQAGTPFQTMNSSGQLSAFGDNLEVSDIEENFDATKDWHNEMLAFGQDSFDVFNALGIAMQGTLGITENVGPQIGFILQEAFGGSIDNARLFVDQFGISIDQLVDGLVKVGLQGQQSWHAIEVAIQGVTVASGAGLVAVGDFVASFKQVEESGGRGAQAINGLKNTAIEAIEAGKRSLQELEAGLRASGQFTEEQISALMSALSTRGITSLEQLRDAEVRVLGGVIADMESAGFKWKEFNAQIEKSSEHVNNLGKDIDNLPSEKTVHVNYLESFTGSSEGSSGVTKHADGGVVMGRHYFGANNGLNLMGEAGAEAILPLKRIGGKLGVMVETGGRGRGGNVYNIDARGAAPGVEADIMRAIAAAQAAAVNEAVGVMHDSIRRGAF